MTPKQAFIGASLFLLMALPFRTKGQEAVQKYSLEACYRAAKNNLPVLRNKNLITAQSALQQANLKAQRLPQIQLTAYGSLQSENISLQFPPSLPIEGIDLPLHRTQLYAEAQFPLYDGGRLKAAEAEWLAQTASRQASLTVPEEEVVRQVQQLFFSIHILQKQEEILRSGLQTLRQREQALQNATAAGAALESKVLEVQSQILQTESQLLQIQQGKTGALRVLALLTGLELEDSKQLEMPQEISTLPEPNDFSQRAQIQLLAFRQMELDAQNKRVEAMRRPTLATFAKVGIGYPNPLNFFDDAISPYGIIGLQLSWQPFDWKQSKRKREILQWQRQSLLNEGDQIRQQYAAEDVQLREQIQHHQQQIDKDQELLHVRQQLLEEATTRLEQGVITPTDYLLKWNARQQAELQLELHRLQKLQAQHQLQLLHSTL